LLDFFAFVSIVLYYMCMHLLAPISSETLCYTMVQFCMQTRDDHVQNICWVLCLKGSSLPKMTFSKNYLHVGQQLCSLNGSVGWLGKLTAAKAWMINHAASVLWYCWLGHPNSETVISEVCEMTPHGAPQYR